MANVSSDDMTHVLFTASFLHAFSHIFFSVCGALYFFAQSQVMLTHCRSLEFVRMLFPTTCTACHNNSIISIYRFLFQFEMISSNSHLFRPQGSERAEYKGLVLVATICLVLFQFTCILFFISSVVFPLKLILLHASLRCRNTKSKVIAHFGPQFSYGSYIFQVSNVAETFGLKKRTPMGFLLNELGIEPDMYMNKKKTM